MSEGKKFLIFIIVINVIGWIVVLTDITLVWVSAFVIGFNVLLLPHLSKFIKE